MGSDRTRGLRVPSALVGSLGAALIAVGVASAYHFDSIYPTANTAWTCFDQGWSPLQATQEGARPT